MFKKLSQDKKNLLEKFLKHKDFDFSHIQPDHLFKIQQNNQLKQIILDNTINTEFSSIQTSTSVQDFVENSYMR